jgi:hypothetical protein
MKTSYTFILTAAVGFGAFAALIEPAGAQETKPFPFKAPDASSTPCGFPNLSFPKNLEVHAAGGYQGRELDFQIDQSGHQATQIDVAVNRPGTPVALILTAYEPTVWNLGWTPGTQIVAVLVAGHHRQAVAGLDRSVPIVNSTQDNRGPCGAFRFDEKNLDALNPMSRRVFGRAATMAYPISRDGKVLMGNALGNAVAWVTSPHTPPESFRDKSAPLAGPAGIEDALRQGLIRRATPADAQAWLDTRAKALGQPARDVPPVARDVPPLAGSAGGAKPPTPSMPIGDTYVVIKPFTYPAGLHGAHSVKFMIPKGMPKPKGNPGHSDVFDFNDPLAAKP